MRRGYRGAAAAHDHAREHRDPQARRGRGDPDVPHDVPEALHARDPDPLQRGDPEAPDVQLLPHVHQGRLHRGHLRHVEVVRVHLQVRGRHRGVHPQRARDQELHPRLQRHLQRHRPHAPSVQRHRKVRGPRWRQAQRLLRHLLGAVARGHPRVARPAQEPRHGARAGPGPVLRALGARLVHEARGGQRGLVPVLPQRGPGFGGLLGRRV
mmetsp:Transcript_46515/g.92002  ORF Transcript_46515/g.92002 Transcript_46515/m.92002 type:complete len:210 (+) Transcript_46515:535-1164(+)